MSYNYEEKMNNYRIQMRVKNAREELMKKAISHVKKASADQIFALKIMNGIPDDIRIKLFEEYLLEWDLNHQDLEKIKKVAKNKINNPKIRIYDNYKKNGLPNDKINCEKESRPKVLICQSDKYIDFFLLPDFIPTDNKKTRIIKIKEKAL